MCIGYMVCMVYMVYMVYIGLYNGFIQLILVNDGNNVLVLSILDFIYCINRKK